MKDRFDTLSRKKRTLDLAAVVPALLFSSPLWLLIAVAIRLDSPGPILFRQDRVGQNRKQFCLLKFRTMKQNTPNVPTDQMAQSGMDYRTQVGRFLRRTSLDELPQLFNVLRGEMSLVGPRPALDTQRRVNDLRIVAGVDVLLPGITGWAQINGRDELNDVEKVRFDAEYKERLLREGILLDVKILLRTLGAIFTGRGNR